MTTPEAPFEQPWHAQLFALTVALNDAGHFTWSEWAATFGPRVKHTEADAYWDIWSEALVALLEDRGLVGADDVRALMAR
ncbi:MAG: nitrile hydratase accessory protein [Pseudomonadota bacterium]